MKHTFESFPPLPVLRPLFRFERWQPVAVVIAMLAPMAAADSTYGVGQFSPPGNSASTSPSVSNDGRYIAFWSVSNNFVPGDTNGVADIFVHDTSTATTTRVSVGVGGLQANGESTSPSISANGRFVAFQSIATNLIGASDTNGAMDVFVRDLQLSTTTRVSLASGGAQSPTGGLLGSYGHAISDDGRYVGFSSASPLVASDTNGLADVYRYDRTLLTTTRFSVSTGGAEGNMACSSPAITGDGRFIAFLSGATNLVAGDTNAKIDVFVRDHTLSTTTRASVLTGGAQSNGDSSFPSLSLDGRYVAFQSASTNLVAGDTNARDDVFVHDRTASTTTRVSVATGGAQVNPLSNGQYTSISGDGRYIVFDSDATNVVGGDTNGDRDAFVHDRSLGVTNRVSISTYGVQSDQPSYAGAISPNGSNIAFYSGANNFGVPNGFGVIHPYIRNRNFMPQPFCLGDGTGTACPCGNNSGLELVQGCAHSSGFGSRLTTGGNASLANDTLSLTGFNQPASTLGLFFQGSGLNVGGYGSAFGDGLLCVANITRLGVKAATPATSTYPMAGDPKISVQGVVTAPAMRYYQLWFRDSASFCTPATSNLTNGMEVEWKP